MVDHSLGYAGKPIEIHLQRLQAGQVVEVTSLQRRDGLLGKVQGCYRRQFAG